MKKILTVLALLGCGLAAAPAVRGQGYTDALLTSINVNTTFPCGNNGATDTLQIQAALQQAAKYGGGTVDLTCYQGAISLDSDIFTPISASILMYLPEHAVTVNANATIPSNFELCGGPGASIAAGGGFTLTNNATPCFNGFTSGGGGGSCPGVGANELQGNNGGVCGGVPGSTIDFTSGQIALGALTADPVLLVNSQPGNDAIDANSLGDEDSATIAANSNATTNPGTTSFAMRVQSEAEDDTGSGAESYAEAVQGFLSGTNATGSLTALDIVVGPDWTGGTPSSSIGINIEPSGSPGGFPAGTVSGISVDDQNEGDQAASTLNAAVSIQPQTAGPTVYGINDANGLFTFQGWNSPETDTLANLTTQSASLPAEGFQKLCSDCDTPAYAGAPCTNSGDVAGAVAVYIQGALYCYGKTATAPGGSPGSPDGSLQGNNTGSFAGVPGSSVDFVNGTVAISPTGMGTALALSSDAVGDTTLFVDCNTPSGETPSPCLYSQTATTDNSGGGNFGYGGIFGANITGTDMTGDTVFGIQASAASAGTGSPLEVTGYFAQGSNGSNPDPPQIISGVHIADQHFIPPAALTLNAGLIVDSQTVGADVYGIHDANGLFTFQGWNSPETDTLANLTTQSASLPAEGFQKLCSDCDTPLTEGAVCTNVGDNAGALALYIRGALHCF